MEGNALFKLGSFTDEISEDLDHACKVCLEYGATGAEIRSVWNTPVHKLSDAQVRDIKKIVADNGMTVCSIGSPFGKCELNKPEEIADHMDILRRCADIGHELGCTMVRGFAFWGHGLREKPWGKMFKAYEPVPGILEEKDIVLGLENEWACLVGTAQHLRYFLDHVRHPRIKAIWDLANHVQDPDGVNVQTVPLSYDALKADIIHVHMKDAAPTADGKVPNVFIGTGICRWKEQFQALKNDGYEGFCSLETHVDPPQCTPELKARYASHLKGEGREGASRVCLAWIRDVISELE
jgi:sugar phosphate isomerase/epimerase